MRWLREFMELPVYLRAMLIVDLMCNFGIGLVMPIELLFATHSLGATMSEAALLVTISSVGSLISNPIIGWVSDRRSSWLAMHTAMIFSVIGPLIFTVAHDYRAAVAGAFVSGLGMGMQTSWASILTQISTREQHRIVYGINQASSTWASALERPLAGCWPLVVRTSSIGSASAVGPWGSLCSACPCWSSNDTGSYAA